MLGQSDLLTAAFFWPQVERLNVVELVQKNHTFLLSAKPEFPRCGNEVPASWLSNTCSAYLICNVQTSNKLLCCRRYECIASVEGYAGLHIRLAPQVALRDLLSGRLPVHFKMQPLVFVHRQLPHADNAV